MAAVRHLGFVWGHIWATHSEYLGVSITVQNLVMIDAAVFVINIWRVWLEMPIHAHKIGVLGNLIP